MAHTDHVMRAPCQKPCIVKFWITLCLQKVQATRKGSANGVAFGVAQKEPSPFHVPKSEFDAGMLAFQNKVFGANAERVADVPPLPVASWNRKPGYLVRPPSPPHPLLSPYLQEPYDPRCSTHSVQIYLSARSDGEGAPQAKEQGL